MNSTSIKAFYAFKYFCQLRFTWKLFLFLHALKYFQKTVSRCVLFKMCSQAGEKAFILTNGLLLFLIYNWWISLIRE